jgi:hypothetical protein
VRHRTHLRTMATSPDHVHPRSKYISMGRCQRKRCVDWIKEYDPLTFHIDSPDEARIREQLLEARRCSLGQSLEIRHLELIETVMLQYSVGFLGRAKRKVSGDNAPPPRKEPKMEHAPTNGEGTKYDDESVSTRAFTL